MGYDLQIGHKTFNGSGWSADGSLDSIQYDAIPTPPRLPAEHGPTESLFTPNFMKALQMFTGAIPALNIEAKNSTFVDTLMHNKGLRESLFKLALFLCSAVPEMMDKERNPRLYGTMRFLRNVLALEKIRREIKEKFVVHGGTNLDIWNLLVRQTAGVGKEDEISYVPPGLNRINTVFGAIGCNTVDHNIMYAMCEYGKSGKEFAVSSGFGRLLGEDAVIRSVFWYGPELQTADDGMAGMKILRKDTGNEWYWLQVFEVTEPATLTGNSPNTYYLVYQLMRTTMESKPGELPSRTFFMQTFLIASMDGCMNMTSDSFMDMHRVTYSHMSSNILKSLKYSMFDPKSTIISVSMFRGTESHNNIMFYKRVTKYSGEGAVHILNEYDTIRNGIRRCLDKNLSRGYAFVGLPGTGKTIMMNQLVNEFPEIPVIKFSMQGFTGIDGSMPGQSSVLLDVMQSLADAGFSKVFMCCDDMDSVDMTTKNRNVESIIMLIDSIHATTFATGSVIFMATINDPTTMHSTVIKRGNRIDEVIEVPCPDKDAIRRLINHVKSKDDPTDYTAPNFESAISRMADEHLSLADMATMMSNMQIYGNPGEDGKYTPGHVLNAIDRILLSRANASKQYELR